jgi:GTPase SAR1 family protein
MLRDRALAAFDRAVAELGPAPGVPAARAILGEHRVRLISTLRVALVGRVSSGKSTLVNALLGGYQVATGVEELTYNVNWLRYGEEPGLLVHFTDGQPSQRRDLADLERITVRARDDDGLREYLSRIDYIEVSVPSPRLVEFDLIDTPGLDSHFAGDSANTLRFLGRTGDEVRAATVTQASKADALVLVFARGLARSEAELLADFRGNGFATTSPITAIGALTKVELYWPARDPMAEGRRVAGKLMEDAGARRLLFDLRPVASLVGAGSATLTGAEFADLTSLSALAPETLARRAQLGPLFTSKEYDDVPVPAARRRALFARLGGYGIVLACGLIREGVAGLDELRGELDERSGLRSFRDLLVGHFGNRADLIKLQRAITGLQEQHAALRPAIAPRERLLTDGAIAEVTRLSFAEHAFEELATLQRYYDGRLELTDDQAGELLEVTGEHGITVAARLGLPAATPPTVLLAQARQRLQHWAAYTTDPSHSGPTRRAGQTIQRSYELLIRELGAAGSADLAGPRATMGAA